MDKAIDRAADIKRYVHMIISFLLMFFFRFLPTFSTVTPEGMQILGIFIGVIYGWLFIGMLWTSILTFVALSLTSVTTLNEVFVQGFGSNVFLMVLFMWILGVVLSEAKISDVLAIKLMSLKISNNRPWIFFAVLMLGAWALAVLLGGIIPIILFTQMVINICKRFGYQPYDKTPTFLFFGIMVASCMGQMVLPIQGTPLALFGIYLAMDPAFVMDFGKYMILSIPMTLLICGGFWLLSRYVFRVDFSRMANISAEIFDKSESVLDKKQKMILLIFISVLVCLVVPPFLPVCRIKMFLTKLGTCGPAFIALIVMMTVKMDGEPLMDFRKAIGGVSWDVLLTVASSMPLLALVTSDITGVVPMIQSTFTPLLGQLSPTVFCIVTVLLVIVMTNFCSNYAAAIVGFTLIVVFSGVMGFVREPAVFTILICSHLAFATPAASVFAQIVFANTEWIKPSQFVKYTTLMLIPLSIIAALFGIGFGNLIY